MSKVTARMVFEGVGFKLRRPRENYEDAAFAVWYLMRETGRNDEAAASDVGGRDGYHVVGMGLVQAIALLWPTVSENKSESAAALTAIRKHLQKHQAAEVIVPGRNNRQSEWWVAATWTRDEDIATSQPVETPTDWTPDTPADEGGQINGKVIQLPEREPGDSIADRVTKATEIIDSVILELQDQVNGLTEEVRTLTKKNNDLEAENRTLHERFEAASHALHDEVTP